MDEQSVRGLVALIGALGSTVVLAFLLMKKGGK